MKGIFGGAVLVAGVLFGAAALPAGTGSGAVAQAAVCPSTGIFNVPAPSGGDDRVVIQTVLDAAIECLQSGTLTSANVLFAPDASYYLSSRPDRWEALTVMTPDITIPSVENLNINGRGATLRVDPISRAAWYVRACNGCTLRNMTIRFAQPAGTQGLVTAVNASAGTMDIKIQDGYTVGEIPEGFATRRVGGDSGMHANYRVYASGQIPNHVTYPQTATPYLIIRKVVKIGAETVRLYGEPGAASWKGVLPKRTVVAYPLFYDGSAKRQSVAANLQASRTLLESDLRYDEGYFVGDGSPMISITLSDQFALENITVTDFQGQGVQAAANRKITIDGLRLVSDGVGSLWTNDRGGLLLRNNHGPITVKNSFFENIGDDSLGYATSPFVIDEVTDLRRMVIRIPRSPESVITPGDRFGVYDASTDSFVRFLTVAEVTATRPNGGNTRFAVYFTSRHGITTASMDDYALVNLNASNASTTITNNVFIGSLRNGIIARSGGRISGNTFINLGLSAVHHSMSAERPNAGGNLAGGSLGNFERLVVSGNTAIDLDDPFLYQSSGSGNMPYEGAVMSNNTIIRSKAPVVQQTGSNSPTTGTGNAVYTQTSLSQSALSKDSTWKGTFGIHEMSATNLANYIATKSPVPLLGLRASQNLYGF
jgi:hypothetical protein